MRRVLPCLHSGPLHRWVTVYAVYLLLHAAPPGCLVPSVSAPCRYTSSWHQYPIIQRLLSLQTISLKITEFFWHYVGCLLPQMGACSVFLLSDIHTVRGTYRGFKATKVTFLPLQTILCIMAHLATGVATYLRSIF